jgi:soluble lytic murein transglycosylase-like protein
LAKLSFDEVKQLVQDNNKSAKVSDNLLICLIWKESGFDPATKNSSSSATGLMQVTKAAVTDVNANTPKGVHFTHAEMTNAAKNIQCGSYYLDIRIKRAGNDTKKGIEKYGTGSGYADNILACETCLDEQGDGKSAEQTTPCLFAIHK